MNKCEHLLGISYDNEDALLCIPLCRKKGIELDYSFKWCPDCGEKLKDE